jgi:hypothetical protein
MKCYLQFFAAMRCDEVVLLGTFLIDSCRRRRRQSNEEYGKGEQSDDV